MIKEAAQAAVNNAGHIAAGTGIGSTIAAHVLQAQPYLSAGATVVSIVSGTLAILWYAQRVFGQRPRDADPPS